MTVETPDRAVFGEVERELVQAARRRNVAGAAGPVRQVDLHSFWRVPGKPAAVLKWFESHPPQGWANSSTGSGGSGGTTLHWNVTFGFPTVPGRTASEYLTFTTAAARGGGTAVRVDVQTIWVIPRPHDSIVPATVDEIEWSSATGSTSAADHTFSSEANVRKLVGWLNAIPLLRFPAGDACFSGSPASGFRFTLFGGTGASPVAVATWNGCGGVALDIAGKRYYAWLDTDQTAGNRLAAALMSGSIH
jgi:hypothetical protein